MTIDQSSGLREPAADAAACSRLREALQLDAFYHPLIQQTVGSTNREVMIMAADAAPEGTLLVALEQKQGRGRHGRVWHSPPGNLYMSLLLRPKCSFARMGELSFVVACALSAALLEIQPDLDIQHKWPNDILVGQAKISGILLESGPTSSNPWVTAGVGINIQSAPTDMPYAVTTLHREYRKSVGDSGHAAPDVAKVLNIFAAKFHRFYQQWQATGFASIREIWLARAYRLEESVTVKLGKRQLEGIFQDLDGDGALILTATDGRTRRITAGELFFPDLPLYTQDNGSVDHAAGH